jgi:hypothetical protein
VRSFSRDEDKHKTVNKGCAAIRREKLMGETLGIALIPVLGGAMPGGTPVTVRGWIYYGLQAAIFGASRLLEGLVDIGSDSL